MSNYPIETAFMSNSSMSWRDPLIPNRIHFKLPEQWYNSSNNAVIGIRNLFIAKSFKNPIIKFSYDLWKHEEDEPSTLVHSGSVVCDKYFDDEILLKDFISSQLNPKLDNLDLYSKLDEQVVSGGIVTSYGFTAEQIAELLQYPFLTTSFEYVVDPVTGEHYNRFVISSPFNDLPDEKRSYDAINQSTATHYSVTYHIAYKVELMNSDAQAMFINQVGGENSFNRDPIYFNHVWDRNSCILFSNIAEQSDSGYLGHTRRQAIPEIKYYKLNGARNSFWVDLFASCDHKAPVILPGSDELIIEAQLL